MLPGKFLSEVRVSGMGEFNVMGIGEQFYFIASQFSPDWFAYSEDMLGEPAPKVAVFAAALVTRITDLTYLNEQTLGEAPVHHLQGSVAPEVPALVDEDNLPTENAPIDIWIGTKDSLVRRYHLVEPDGTTTLTLSRFDEAVTIVAPVNPRPAEELAELFGGAPGFESPEEAKEAIAALSTDEQDCLQQALGDAAFAELKSGARVPTAEEFQKGGE